MGQGALQGSIGLLHQLNLVKIFRNADAFCRHHRHMQLHLEDMEPLDRKQDIKFPKLRLPQGSRVSKSDRQTQQEFDDKGLITSLQFLTLLLNEMLLEATRGQLPDASAWDFASQELLDPHYL